LRTFGECQMIARPIARRWLILPLINKGFRVCHPPLTCGNFASVTLNHQKCVRARNCWRGLPGTYGRERAIRPNKLYLIDEKGIIALICAFVVSNSLHGRFPRIGLGVAKGHFLAKSAVSFSSNGVMRRNGARFALISVGKMGHQSLLLRLSTVPRNALVMCRPLITPDNCWHKTTWPEFQPSLPRGLTRSRSCSTAGHEDQSIMVPCYSRAEPASTRLAASNDKAHLPGPLGEG
jgi:hypothetical protein